MICKVCGNVVDNNERFCPSCGAVLSTQKKSSLLDDLFNEMHSQVDKAEVEKVVEEEVEPAVEEVVDAVEQVEDTPEVDDPSEEVVEEEVLPVEEEVDNLFEEAEEEEEDDDSDEEFFDKDDENSVEEDLTDEEFECEEDNPEEVDIVDEDTREVLKNVPVRDSVKEEPTEDAVEEEKPKKKLRFAPSKLTAKAETSEAVNEVQTVENLPAKTTSTRVNKIANIVLDVIIVGLAVIVGILAYKTFVG